MEKIWLYMMKCMQIVISVETIEEHSSISLKKTIVFHTAAKTLAQFSSQYLVQSYTIIYLSPFDRNNECLPNTHSIIPRHSKHQRLTQFLLFTTSDAKQQLNERHLIFTLLWQGLECTAYFRSAVHYTGSIKTRTQISHILQFRNKTLCSISFGEKHSTRLVAVFSAKLMDRYNNYRGV